MKQSEITTLIIVGGVVAGLFIFSQAGSNAIQTGSDNITGPLGQGLEIVTIIAGIGLAVALIPIGL